MFHITIPPQREVRGQPVMINVEPQEKEVYNAPKVQYLGEVTNVEFRKAIRMLNQVGKQRGSQ